VSFVYVLTNIGYFVFKYLFICPMMRGSDLLSVLHRMDRVLSMDAGEISADGQCCTSLPDGRHSISLALRYDDGNSAWPEQIFDNENTKQVVGAFGINSDLHKYSNTAKVLLTVVGDPESVTNIETRNGHIFQYLYHEQGSGPLGKGVLCGSGSFFTFGGGVLTFHTDDSDVSGQYEYALVHIPPRRNSNMRTNTGEATEADEESNPASGTYQKRP